MHNWIFQMKKNVGNWTLKGLSLFQTPFTVSRLFRPWHCPAILTLEVEVQLRFENKENVGIEVPKVQLSFSKEGICSENLPWFQTTLTVSRLSRPWDCPALLPLEVDVQLRFPKEGKCFELNFSLSTSESLIEFFKRRKMFELPKVLPWFQTSRMFPDRPDGGWGHLYI